MTIELNTFIYLITGIFGTYIIYEFMGIFFDREEINKSIEFLTYLIYFVVSSTAYLALNIPMFTLTINLILFFILSFNYKGPMKRRLFVTFFLYLILASIESIVYLLSGFIRNSLFTMNPVYFSTIGSISSKMISYIVVLLIGNYKSKQKDIEIPFVHWILILLIPLGSLYIIINLMEDSNLSIYSISVNIGILLGINIVAFYLYDVLSRRYQSEVEETKKIYHNMENHISIVKGCIQAGEETKAISYLNHMSKEVYMDEVVNESELDIR